MAATFKFGFSQPAEPEAPLPLAPLRPCAQLFVQAPPPHVLQQVRTTAVPLVPNQPPGAPGPQLARRVLSDEELQQITAGTELEPILKVTDIASGVYEGGFKIWEGSVDLAQFLFVNPQETMGRRVLELGCGGGIPGIVALLAGAQAVHFNDFNQEVLQHLTAFNVALNATPHVSPDIAFFAGDWLALPVPSASVDVILTAETLYTPGIIASLLAAVSRLLRPGGCALIAAKTYYFGTGGGTNELHQQIERHYPAQLTAARVVRIENGVSNIREIVRIVRL
eukprot:TRINITY_DN5061_c0_g1_i1.p1 TRINITY_DN5061_c0_g1~~TRINITY_DN5061_c0_g1_i1.p1  ORF type:complete len:289 (+),score=61.80 TRINITY_DN5061_c0_g1_i1:25-867(+)